MMRAYLFIVFFCNLYTVTVLEERKNACSTMQDYRFIDTSPNCWYNPDVTATVPEMILSSNYPLSTYIVTTKDGYRLTLFRIPKQQGKGIILLQHAFVTAGHVWVDKRNESAAFAFSDAGFDVWIGNFRGTIYSAEHEYLSPDSNAYWNHSFHEMGIYDLPAQIDLVRQETGTQNKIIYVGYSMGTTAAFIYNALLPNHAEKNIEIFFDLAPVAYIPNSRSGFRTLTFLGTIIKEAFEDLQVMDIALHNGLLHNVLKFICIHNTEFCLRMLLWINGLENYIKPEASVNLQIMNIIPHNGLLHNLIKYLCIHDAEFCLEVLLWINGPDKYFKPEWLTLIVYQNLAGFSLKDCAHFYQLISSKRFQQYDYGHDRNILYYGSGVPPLYPTDNIKVPHYFIYGENDWLTVPEDVEALFEDFPREATKYGKMLIKDYNHLDGLYGSNSRHVIYDHIVYVLENIVK